MFGVFHSLRPLKPTSPKPRSSARIITTFVRRFCCRSIAVADDPFQTIAAKKSQKARGCLFMMFSRLGLVDHPIMRRNDFEDFRRGFEGKADSLRIQAEASGGRAVWVRFSKSSAIVTK